MTERELSKLIEEKYGAVKRARGAFLYTASGVRLTDLYLAGGKAILGWRGGQAMTVFKNVMSRGAIGGYTDGGYWKEVTQAVNVLFSGAAESNARQVFAFRDKSAAYKAALAIAPSSTMFWRPWGGMGCDARCIVFVPPFPWGEPLYLAAVQGAEGLTGDALPPPLAAAIARSIYDLIAELPRRSESDWFTHDKVLCTLWTRRGPYLVPKCDAGQYDIFVQKCLDCRLVISPCYNTPSIISAGLDGGLFKAVSSININIDR